MGNKIRIADLQEFDAAEFIGTDDASVAAYLTEIIAADDAALLASALGHVARSRGMASIAEAAGITREALYKALRPGAQPRFETVSRVCHALGLKFVVQASAA